MNKKVIIAVAAAIFLLGVIHLATSEEKKYSSESNCNI